MSLQANRERGGLLRLADVDKNEAIDRPGYWHVTSLDEVAYIPPTSLAIHVKLMITQSQTILSTALWPCVWLDRLTIL